MKMKQVIVTIPENCELEQKGNTYTIVEKENKLSYKDVIRELFYNKSGFYIKTDGTISYSEFDDNDTYKEDNNCISRKQAEKLLAINKLMNVAKYLNGDWQPDWTYLHERRWYVRIGEEDKIEVEYSNYHCGDIYFITDKLAKQAIEILGEDTIKLALCTDY